MVKIMVVDDEKDIREMIELMMQKEGFETEVAENGDDFLKKIDKFKPDLVTLDVMMPGPRTKDILVRLNDKESNPKIILLSVIRFSEEEKQNILGKSNVVDYVTKPFDVEDLSSTIKRHLDR
ncbi:MAG: response regulator [Candidatus Thermoplasmatota archaeon]